MTHLTYCGNSPQNDHSNCPSSTECVARVVAWDREESDTCQAGTPGCCINHNADHGSCEGW